LALPSLTVEFHIYAATLGRSSILPEYPVKNFRIAASHNGSTSAHVILLTANWLHCTNDIFNTVAALYILVIF